MTEAPTKQALICGVTGQDGSYLTELLIAKGYEVHGIIRRTSRFNADGLDHIYSDPHESQPEISFEELVRSMVEHDLELAQQELTLVRAGYQVEPRGGAHV